MLTTVTVTPAGRPMSLVIKAPGASVVGFGSRQPRDGRLIQPGDRGKAGSQVVYCGLSGRIDVPLALLGAPLGEWTKAFGIWQYVRAIKGCRGWR